MTTKGKTVWLGDKWQIGVKFTNADGTAATFSNDAVPYGEFFLGKYGSTAIVCTIANGKLIVLDQTPYPGQVVFELQPTDYPTADLAKFLAAASPPVLYNRLHVELLDIAGEPTTQKIIQLDVRNPAYDTDDGVDMTAAVVTIIGSLTIGRTILKQALIAASSYTFNHSFDHSPNVWAVDSSGDPVVVDYTNASPSSVAFTFSQPFTGTVYMS